MWSSLPHAVGALIEDEFDGDSGGLDEVDALLGDIGAEALSAQLLGGPGRRQV